MFTIPEMALIVGTRLALGVGIGLLLAQRFNKDQRRAAGAALVGFGALTTIPIVIGILSKRSVSAETAALVASRTG